MTLKNYMYNINNMEGKEIESKCILVTGGNGLVGSAIKNVVSDIGTNDAYIFTTSHECDLRDRNATLALFEKYKPTHIIHLAAIVRGFYKSSRQNVEMFRDNIRINENVLEAANANDVQKGIFCVSACVYPAEPTTYPMTEDMIYESTPHQSNIGYCYAKRMLCMQCDTYNKELGRQYICVIPANIYGKHDNFNIENCHVVPSIIHRMYNNINDDNDLDFTMFGTGIAMRQFLYADDVANIFIMILNTYENTNPINIANTEVSIMDITNIIKEVMGHQGNIVCDNTKSDGCLQRTISNDYFNSLFDYKFKSLNDGLKETIEWFCENYYNCRR
jgi:GDP-L-fucose synthase